MNDIEICYEDGTNSIVFVHTNPRGGYTLLSKTPSGKIVPVGVYDTLEEAKANIAPLRHGEKEVEK